MECGAFFMYHGIYSVPVPRNLFRTSTTEFIPYQYHGIYSVSVPRNLFRISTTEFVPYQYHGICSVSIISSAMLLDVNLSTLRLIVSRNKFRATLLSSKSMVI